MSKTLIPTHLRTHVASQIKESILEPANTAYYAFVGKHTDYANGAAAIPEDSVQSTLIDAYDNMIFGKRILDDNVRMLIPRIEWESGVVYTPYDSNTEIFGTNFYVAVQRTGYYDVFKCLDNNQGVPSTAAPNLNETSAADDYYSTIDGYVWKYMYTITSTEWDNYTTDFFMPVNSNTAVTGNAVPGSIEVYRVQYGGSNYDATYANTFTTQQIQVGSPYYYILNSDASSNDQFYTGSCIFITTGGGAGQIRKIDDYDGAARRITVNTSFTTALTNTSCYEITPLITVDGDGSGAEARGIVNTASGNSIYKVEVLTKGIGYSYGTILIYGNTGGVSNAAVIVPVISPQGGHGANTQLELGSTAIGIGVTFANTESGNIPASNDFRQIGIVKDPLFANVVISVSNTSGAGFVIGEKVIQNTSNAAGYVESYEASTLQVANVAGVFTTGPAVIGQASATSANVDSFTINNEAKNFNTFNQLFRYNIEMVSGTFQADEQVYQNTLALANGLFHSANSSVLNLTKVRGVINENETVIGLQSGAVANVVGRTIPDLVKYTGDVIYLTNMESEISRSNTQSEQVKIVLKF